MKTWATLLSCGLLGLFSCGEEGASSVGGTSGSGGGPGGSAATSGSAGSSGLGGDSGSGLGGNSSSGTGGAPVGGSGNAGENHGGTSAGEGGAGTSAGSAGTSSNCAEIRIDPLDVYVDPNEWAWAEEPFVKILHSSLSGKVINISRYSVDGTLSLEKTFKIDESDKFPSKCGWKDDHFLCVDSRLVSWGNIEKAEQFTKEELLPEGSWAIASHWDGETFSVHIRSHKYGDDTLELVRVGLEGQILHEPIYVGKGANNFFTNERPRIATHAGSGRSFIIAGSGSKYLRVITAHERDGTQLIPMGTLLDTSPHLNNSYLAIGAYEGGVLIATNGDSTAKEWWPQPHFYHLSAMGELTTLPDIPLPDGETPRSGKPQMAVVAHGANNGWIAVFSDDEKKDSYLRIVDWKEGKFGEAREVMLSNSLSFRAFDPIAIEAAGTRWVGFRDESDSKKTVVRMLRVDDPACHYPSLVP